MTTPTTTSPGSYYHAHVKPSPSNSHLPLDGIHANTLPSSACLIAATSWLLATEYEHVDLATGYVRSHSTLNTTPVLTVWVKTTKSKLHLGAYTAMRIANVAYTHVGALHGFGRKQVAREPTDSELNDQLKASLS